MIKGACLCGDIRFQVTGPVWSVSVCHCGQCRKQSGHVWASAVAAQKDIKIEGAPRWYASSEVAERGFCGACGAFLFWRMHAEHSMSFSMGALEPGHGLTLEKHIFTADKGDYYDINDGLPQV